MARAERSERLKFIVVDIGPTGERGFPTDGCFRLEFPRYSSGVFEQADSWDSDCVLIDGRFRVACLFQTIMNICNPDAVILFHDIWGRKEYYSILKYLVEIERVESMGVFKIFPHINRNDVTQLYERYKYQPW